MPSGSPGEVDAEHGAPPDKRATAICRCWPPCTGSLIGSQFFLGSATQVTRVPVCGNGICEAGERAMAGAVADVTTCRQDCGHPYTACPAVEGFGGGETFQTPFPLNVIFQRALCPRPAVPPREGVSLCT